MVPKTDENSLPGVVIQVEGVLSGVWTLSCFG